jgi:hypothetical protein
LKAGIDDKLQRLLVQCLALALLVPTLHGQTSTDRLISAIVEHAELFQQNARSAVSRETLIQRSYLMPPHGHFAIGAAAVPVFADFFEHEIVSEYSVGSLKGDPAGALLELREVLANDGRTIQTPVAARKALERDLSLGAEKIRRQLLTQFTALGLVDVATDYGLLLLLFTRRGLPDLELVPAGTSWVGTEEAAAYEWRQHTAGLLEFRGRKVTRRPMHGRIWARKSDGMPLRISASMEHDEPKHNVADDATVDYELSRAGCPMPASVVHRHFVDGQVLTENLYTYGPFRLFTSDTTIRYTDEADPKK